MPVHNALPYLDKSIGSILVQSFGDFEFLILDDGSTDGSDRVLREWAAKDRRVRLVFNDQCSGPVGSSNRVVAEARAQLVARMDADDVADPHRLRRQLDVMLRNPDVMLCGALHSLIDDRGRTIRPPDYAQLKRKSLFAPFGHPSVMFRRSAFETVGGYRSEAVRWEDVDLYLRLASIGTVAVLPFPLINVRVSESSSRVANIAATEKAMDLMLRAMRDYRTTDDYAAVDLQKLTMTPELRLLPRSFVPAAALRMWAGHSPQILGRLVRSGSLGLNRDSLKVLVWALWATMSPRSLRLVKLWLLRSQNRDARIRVPSEALAWAPGKGLSPLRASNYGTSR